MKKQQLEFTVKYEHWSGEQWRNVMFIYESTFQQFAVCRQDVRSPQGKGS